MLLCSSHAASVAGPGAVVLWQCEAKGTLRPLGVFFGDCVGLKESMADLSQKYSKEKLSSSGFDFQHSWRLIAIGSFCHSICCTLEVIQTHGASLVGPLQSKQCIAFFWDFFPHSDLFSVCDDLGGHTSLNSMSERKMGCS